MQKEGRAILWVVLPFLFISSMVLAAQVEVTSVKVEKRDSRPRLTVALEGLKQKPILEVINGGIPYTVEYQVRIMEERLLWDKTLWEGVYSRTLRLNLITREYRIEDPTAYPKRFSEMDAFIKEASVATFPLPQGVLDSGAKGVYVEVRVYRNSIHLFFPLSLIAPLIRPDSDFDTGWIRVER